MDFMAKDEEINNFKVQDKIDQSLLDARRVFLSDDINTDSAEDVIRKLWYLEMKDPGKPILLIINSPGGAIDSGFAIWDQIKMITSPVIYASDRACRFNGLDFKPRCRPRQTICDASFENHDPPAKAERRHSRAGDRP